MKKKFLIGLTILIFITVMLLTLLTINSNAANWYIEYDESQRISWYYEVVDGEAVNVRTTGGGATRLQTLVIPSQLGGYPVTSIRNSSVSNIRRSYYNVDGGGYVGEAIGYNVTGTFGSITPNNCLKEVILPEGLKTIGVGSFEDCYKLEKINIPQSLERIEAYAFVNCLNLKEIQFNSSVDYIEYTAFSSLENVEINNAEVWKARIGKFGASQPTLKNVTIGEGVKEVKGAIFTTEDANVQISSDIETIYADTINYATDVWVDKNEEDVNIIYTSNNTRTYYHFNNSEKIETKLPEGIKAINTLTNEEFTTTRATTGSNFTFKLEAEEGYNYDKITVFIESVGKYLSSDKILTKLDLRLGQEYTIENVTRSKKIYVETRDEKLDLNLRQYIWGIDNEEMTHSRAPIVELQQDRTIKYKHTKNQLYPSNGRKVRYGIRVYNEGTSEGTANEITEYIPEGLKFDETSEINTQYGWIKADDGRSATTSYLSEKTIKAFTVYNEIDYKEIFIDLIVDTGEIEEFKRLVAVAEIAQESSSDSDSTPGNIILPISEDFMKEESENSNANSYIQCEEDDMDFEAIATSKNVLHSYRLVVNKIDGIDNQLLNGATFDLMDENQNVLKTGVTANGGKIDFGTVYAYGDKKTRYYIKETYTPEGYKNHLKYIIRLDVVPQVEDINTEESVRFELDIHDIDVDTSKYETIEISTKEQLKAIESNREEKYVLTQDIDLGGENWTPLNVENIKLDGQGHKITNLKIEGNSDTNKKVGLFATYSGVIENLTLEAVNINITKNVELSEEWTNETQYTNYLNSVYGAEETEEEIPAVGGIIAYSKDVILKNCKVTGNIKSEYKNIGGLVGHSKAGTITVFRNCTNESIVEAKKEYEYNSKEWKDGQYVIVTRLGLEGRNAGGMIGVTLGPVYVTNCKNTGNIFAGKYNAGGMVGTANCTEYNTINVFGQYDDDINVYVKNERINGKYTIKLKKVDEKENNLLAGAKFNVYDRNKNIIPEYEDIELTNGILEVPETVGAIGTDTFYIKETKAPIGYVKLTDTYIKIEVEKTWNREEQKYETNVEYKTLTEEEMESDIAKSNNTSTVATGNAIENTQNRDVILKTNDVTVDQNSINEGQIVSAGINAGGFVGYATCGVEVTDSTNNGIIKAQEGNNAGAVGQITIGKDDKALLYVNNVRNNGNIIQENIKEIEDYDYNQLYSSSGIVAETNSDVEIYNSINDGNITSNLTSGGIIGCTNSDYVTIDNCSNNKEMNIVKLKNIQCADSGGIVGKSLFYKCRENTESANEHSVEKITNCKNNADILGQYNTAGIIGFTNVKDMTIENCLVENSVITGEYEDVAGIVAFADNENLVISNCYVKNEEITIDKDKFYYQASGILGYFASEMWNRNLQKQHITIKDCKVEETNILGRTSASGIFSMLYVKKDNTKLVIENCDVINTDIKSQASGNTYNLGGIMGEICCDYGRKVYTAEISNCNVIGCNLGDVVAETNGDYSVGGIVAKISNSNDSNVTVKDSNVKNTTLINCDGDIDTKNTCYNSAGIIAISDAICTNIQNSNIDDVTIISDNGKIGGIAGILGNTNTQATNVIENCNVNKLTTNNKTNSLSMHPTAGIAARLHGINSKVENVQVTNSNINADVTCVFGGIGEVSNNSWNSGNVVLKDILVESTEITTTQTDANSGSASTNTGILGTASYGIKTGLIENCKFKDSSLIVEGCNVSGILGWGNDVFDIKNCEVNNSIIKNSKTQPIQYISSGGGAAGIVVANAKDIENCKVVNNSRIESTVSSIAGIVTSYAKSVKGCIVENSTIESKSTMNVDQYTSVSGIIGYKTEELKNCTVKNTSIIARSEAVGGISGGTGLPAEIDNCIVDGLTIIHKNDVESNLSNNSTLKPNIGGAIATVENDVEIKNSTFKNITINTKNGTHEMNIGGVVGFANEKITMKDNNTIFNISINNELTEKPSVVGGIIGFVGKAPIIELQNMNISNINLKGGYDIGGLIGSSRCANINGISITDINLEDSTNTYTLGGLIARAQSNISSSERYASTIKIKDIEIKASEGNSNILNGSNTKMTSGKYGILVGITDEVEIDTTGTIKVSNTKINSENDSTALIGMAGILRNVNNVTLDTVEIKSKAHSAGLVGFLEKTTNLTIDGVVLNNVKIEGGSDSAGLIGGSENDNELKINNVIATKLDVTGGSNVGGLIGISNNVEFTNIDITDLNVKASEFNHIGGLSGSVLQTYRSNVTNHNAYLKNISIKSSSENRNKIQGNNSGNGYYAGALIGTIQNKLTTEGTINVENTDVIVNNVNGYGLFGAANQYENAKDITLKNVTYKGSSQKAGGIIGTVYNSSFTAENINYNNVKIEGETYKTTGNYISNCDMGGIIGSATGNGTIITLKNLNNINGLSVNNLGYSNLGGLVGFGIAIDADDIDISNIEVTNETMVSSTSNVGGLIGYASNTDLNEITIIGLDVEGEGQTSQGGLIGTTPVANLNNIEITDETVENTNGSYLTGGVTGIISGHGTIQNVTLKASEGKKNKIYGNTTKSNTYTGIITGFGGIETDNIVVNDTDVNGTNSSGTGTIGMAQTGSIINDITISNVNITAKGNNVGGIVGVSNATISNCTVNNSNITSNSEQSGYSAFVGGITGIISKPGSTEVKLENCNVNNTTVTGINAYAGGIVGLSNNTITGTTITDSEVKSIGETARGTGGIIGHGSNCTGSDTAIINSKVIDTKVTGKEQVGGISGGAVYKIQNCYVGGKENERFEEGNYAVEITGNEGVGSIIGDAGIVSYDSLLMLQMLSNTVKDTKVTRVERALETGETPDIYGMIGMHNRFTETYSRDETENITGNIASNCEVVNIANP